MDLFAIDSFGTAATEKTESCSSSCESEQSGRHGNKPTMLVPVSSPLEDDGGKTEAKEQVYNEQETVIVTTILSHNRAPAILPAPCRNERDPKPNIGKLRNNLGNQIAGQVLTPTTSMPEGVHSNTLFYLKPL